VEFPKCIIEQPPAAQILSTAPLAVDWKIERHRTCLTADEIVDVILLLRQS